MAILIYSQEYLQRLRYSSSDRLATPTNISTSGHNIYFGKVPDATSYAVFIDSELIGSKEVSGSNTSTWLFDEIIDIEDNTNTTYSASFTSNSITYSSIAIKGRNIASTGKFTILFDSTIVFEETDDGSSYWKEQIYRTVVFSTRPTGTLLEFLNSSAEEQVEILSIDASTLTRWDSVTDGYHYLQLVAQATGETSSIFSDSVTFGKNTEFIKGVIYGPFTCVRCVDGDTVVASINGADMKIRMIGVNTPESVASSQYRTENCQEGIDASNYTKAQLTGKNIYIEFDEDIYDRYNRYLCYIYLDAGGANMYNAQLIAQGYGESQYYSPNGAYRQLLDQTQSVARANNVGFWGTGFFPTKLNPPVVTLSGSIISWPVNSYTESYDIKVNGSVLYSYTQIVGASTNTFDLTQIITTSGTYRINVVAQPTNSTHQTSNNSNNITYTC